MALVRSLFEQRTIEYDPTVWRGGGFGRTAAGVDVNAETAMYAGDVYACVRVLSESVAQLPLNVYRRLERGRDIARQHPVHALLHDAPTPEMTAFQLREMLMAHLTLRGKAFCEIEWGADGQVKALWPLHPDSVSIHRDRNSRRLYFDVTLPNGRVARLRAEQVLFLRGLTRDGINTYSPIRLAAEEIGVALATREYGSRFFSNGAKPAGILKYPGQLSDEAYERLSRDFQERYGGLSNAQRTAILEEGLDYESIGIAPEEAQFLETRKFTKSQIAAIFRVPPHMIGDLEHATFSNIEEQSLQFVIYSLSPWLVRLEQQFNQSLLLPSERDSYFTRFVVNALLRGNTLSRYQSHHQSLIDGWMSPNEIREIEDMNPYDGGDQYYIPLNMLPVNGEPSPPAPSPATDVNGEGSRNGGQRGLFFNAVGRGETPQPSPFEGDSADLRSSTGVNTDGSAESRNLSDTEARRVASARQRLITAHRPILEDTIARVVRREVQDITARARRDFDRRSVTAFLTWLTDFYRDHQSFITRQLLPIFRAFAELIGEQAASEVGYELADSSMSFEAFVAAYTEAYASRHAAQNEAAIRRGVDRAEESSADPLDALDELFDEWPEQRATQLARGESTRMAGAVAVAVWAGVGVLRMQWVSMGDSCPYCTDLNGRTVGIQEFFLPVGVEFKPDGAEVVLRPKRNIGHAPAHDGCDCNVIAVG